MAINNGNNNDKTGLSPMAILAVIIVIFGIMGVWAIPLFIIGAIAYTAYKSQNSSEGDKPFTPESFKEKSVQFFKKMDELEEAGRRQNEILITLQRQADAIEALNDKIDLLAGGVNRVAGRVDRMEREPGDRWKKICFEIIKYIALAAAGAALAQLTK